jgi:hypothetical protein
LFGRNAGTVLGEPRKIFTQVCSAGSKQNCFIGPRLYFRATLDFKPIDTIKIEIEIVAGQTLTIIYRRRIPDGVCRRPADNASLHSGFFRKTAQWNAEMATRKMAVECRVSSFCIKSCM